MSLMGMIRVARTQLGMDEEAYRALLLDTLGKRSLEGSTAKEQWCVVEELKARGFRPRPFHKGKELVADPQAKKIRALWLTMADCGIVRDRSEKALASCMRRFTGRTLEDASIKQCQAMIEILKKWAGRVHYEKTGHAKQYQDVIGKTQLAEEKTVIMRTIMREETALEKGCSEKQSTGDNRRG